jgi:hypothetical protein
MERKRTINNSVCGRCFLSLITLLLMSVGMQAEDYNIVVAGIQVTSDNAGNVLGDGKVSWDNSSNTLTLNEATIPGTISSSIADLKVKLVGVSVFNVTMNASGYTYVFDYTGSGNDASPSVTFSADNLGATLLAYGDQENNQLQLVDSYTVNYNPDVSSWINIYRRDTGTGDKPFIRLSKPYLLQIAGESIDDSNKDNVMRDDLSEEGSVARVRFDASNNKLTLTDASISAYNNEAVVSGLDNLTIFLVGESRIYGSNGYTFNKTAAVEEMTVTFTTDGESNGSLYINNLEENLFAEGVTPVYNDVTIKHEGDSHTIGCLLGLKLGGVPVTLFNKDNVLGDGNVSYNPGTHTLTLNSVTIEPENEEDEFSGIEYSDAEDLTIALIGNNSIQGSYGCSAISHSYGVDTPHLYFVKGDAAQHFSLTLIAQSENELIDDFYANYDGLFVFDEEDDGTYTSTISTTAFGGTGSADEPFLMKTAEDLKKFAYHYNEGRFSRNVHIKLNNDIDCEDEEGFSTIADNTDATFCGVFDGNNKTISNLTMTGIGFFGYVEKDDEFGVGTIKNLTLSNFNITGNDYATGGIVETLSNGAVVSHCTVTNSTIACSNNQYNPEVGAIVARLYGSTVTGCTVNNVKVKAETSYTGGSGAASYVGGIVGNASEGIVDSCAVTNGSKITNYYADEYASLNAGAIVGNQYETTFFENFYDYDVNVEKLNGTDVTNKIVKSRYEQRGVGGESYNEQTEEMEANPDIFEGNGAVMYTKKVTLPGESVEASVMGAVETYYSTVVEGDVTSLLVAPGQTAKVNVMPGEGYAIASFTATNTTTGTTISTSSENLGDNEIQYTFTMPDAPVTVAVATLEPIGIRVAGVEVTEQNSANVLGDGKVSFDPETNTLTLNGATINGGIVCSLNGTLTVHLQGQNVIDGGYVDENNNGERAFVGELQTTRLKITTDAENPGQLLLKRPYINEYNNAEYYSNYMYPSFMNGLVESENSTDKKVFIAQGPVATPGEGLYWTDQQYTIPAGTQISCSDNAGLPVEVSVNENSFTLTETGYYNIRISKTVTVDNTSFNQSNSELYIVHNKPGFSVAGGTYEETQQVKITDLPNLPAGTLYYPQVWYYLNDNKNDSIRYTSAEQEIAISESTKVCVYIIDEDSGKVLKSKPVEAEYVILHAPGYHFSDSESGQSYYSSGTTVYNLNFGLENTLPWLINVPEGLTITYASEDENVATIDQTGKITLTGAGHVWLTASNEETAEYAAHSERIRLEIRPSDPQASVDDGAYFVGQKVTLIPTVPNGTIYYSFGWNGEKTKYTEGDEIVLPKGEYEFYTYTRCVTKADESDTDYMQSYGNNHRYYYVYDQPTFSVEAGTYYDNVKVKIENLPNTNSAQVYYYFYDETLEPEDEESVLYHADDVITITESKILKAYLYVEGDSGKTYKSEPVEAEYTIVPVTELNISYGENSRTWASYCASENSLETPEGLQAYVVKNATKMGVEVEQIGYIPQGVGVLLKRTKEITEPIVAPNYTGAEPEAPDNELIGTTASTAVKTLEGSVYVLYNDGFTRATKGSISANRAYLLFPDVIAESRLNIFENETTAIKNVNSETRKDNHYYNLAGQRVAAPKKNELYIVDGEKRIVK